MRDEMTKELFTPCNSLESALLEAKEGSVSVLEFLGVFVKSEVYVPSSTVVDLNGTGFCPLLFDKEGSTLVSAFTERQRITPFVDKVPYCLAMKGGEFLQRIPSEFGVVINPGWEVGMEVTSQGVQEIRTKVAGMS